MEMVEKKEGILKSVWNAIKALGTDYNTEEKEIAKQVEELEKVQKQIHEEQKKYGASLRTSKMQQTKVQQKTVTRNEKNKQMEREIGE